MKKFTLIAFFFAFVLLTGFDFKKSENCDDEYITKPDGTVMVRECCTSSDGKVTCGNFEALKPNT